MDACRICFQKYSLHSLTDQKHWLQIIELCSGEMISENGSKKICQCCSLKLDEFFSFRNKILQSETQWKFINISKETNINSIPKDISKLENAEKVIFKNEKEFPDNANDDNFDREDDENNFSCNMVKIKNENKNSAMEDKEIFFNYDASSSIFPLWNMKNKDSPSNFNDSYSTISVHNKEHPTIDKDIIHSDDTVVNNTLQNMDTCVDLVCEKCGTTYTRKKFYLKHIMMCDHRTKPQPSLPMPSDFLCGICSYGTKVKQKLHKHLAEHFENKDLQCRLCDYEALDVAAQMGTHRFKHYPKEFKWIRECHICNKKCMTCKKLEYHYRSVHLGKKEGQCLGCGGQFSNYTSWRRHDKCQHERKGDDMFTCDYCKKSFLYRSSLTDHILWHTRHAKFVCDHCGKSFIRMRSLTLHINTVHISLDNRVNCNHCKRTFKSELHLQSHLRIVNKEKTLQCSICSKLFAFKNRLLSHEKSHSEERPFRCSVCGSKYKNKSGFMEHMRKHLGILPFSCDKCEAKYASSSDLKRHEAIHTGRKKFACEFCSKSFHERKLLSNHLKSKHSKTSKTSLNV